MDATLTRPADERQGLPPLSSSVLLARQVWTSNLAKLSLGSLTGKRIRLTHLDGKLPNLALMKISAWFKSRGADVTFSKSVTPELWEQPYDLVLGSSIFAWSENTRQIFRAHFPNCVIGGTGTEDATTVEDYIGESFEEYDYSIYPQLRAVARFHTTRLPAEMLLLCRAKKRRTHQTDGDNQ